MWTLTFGDPTEDQGEEVSMKSQDLKQGIRSIPKPDGTWMHWPSPAGPWVEVPTPPPPRFPCEDLQPQGHWSDRDYAAADLEVFKSAVDQLRFVTTMFWQQASFFVLIQSALLTVMSRLLPKENRDPESLLILSVLGLALAVFWGYVAYNRYWIIQQWHRQVRHLDRELDRHLVYESVEVLLEKQWWRKPAWVTTLLPWLLIVGWTVLLITSIGWLPRPNS
jgi:hypothetical protein